MPTPESRTSPEAQAAPLPIVFCPHHGPFVYNLEIENGCPAVVDHDGITCGYGWTSSELPPAEARLYLPQANANQDTPS